jgi:hypothetical protein
MAGEQWRSLADLLDSSWRDATSSVLAEGSEPVALILLGGLLLVAAVVTRRRLRRRDEAASHPTPSVASAPAAGESLGTGALPPIVPGRRSTAA